MKDLRLFLGGLGTEMTIDGHVHTFSHRGRLKHSLYSAYIGFADIEYDAIDKYKDMVALYKKYGGPDEHLLATGLNIEDIEAVCDFLGDRCVGFGELKLYDEFKGKGVNMRKLSFARQVCDFSERAFPGSPKPVYIHYDLRKNKKDLATFERLLRDFPNVPIVLCHCGTSDSVEPEWALSQAVRLASTYSNLWLDLSWSAAKYLSTNPMLITQLPGDRIFLGTDLSPRLEAHGYISARPEDIKKWIAAAEPFVKSDSNLRALFPAIC